MQIIGGHGPPPPFPPPYSYGPEMEGINQVIRNRNCRNHRPQTNHGAMRKGFLTKPNCYRYKINPWSDLEND